MTVSLKFKSFITLLMAAVLLLLPNSPAFAAKLNPQIKIQYVPQDKSKWCWAATSVMLLNYYNKPMGLEEYVEKVLEEKTNKAIPEFRFESELNEMGIYGDSMNKPATWKQVTSSIDKGYPVVVYQQRTGKVGHMLIINGYFDDNLIITNPSNTGGQYEITYDELLDDGNNKWTGTWLNVNKIERKK
ncbi:papain-like cysteine protease family protein [Brevibacillus porteri]|uniref:Peptidase C39-like domain-containing protein n=1 Tax=Brevibacillus porteri TaxID=2126350 RepID=A0ABX5FHQ7_9BACL|nr:papain-like cysteine protease family protein [Brevibacillus porteri]MED1801762.1 papain-like cysteine protease family protein [Brevibacillus porteri]MED2134893.1 papain-like cysteine protease family protein [Brevibacillus porteri]MED2748400.1 papain-like cysteine protease family protein [Brevibacillus porteri]MED2818324.1 papain-like cysteine protease family protein [Brevibacillus porteri]MED2897717.1 papain-like cysteine protease family protein [Brevibacillus porteri]